MSRRDLLGLQRKKIRVDLILIKCKLGLKEISHTSSKEQSPDGVFQKTLKQVYLSTHFMKDTSKMGSVGGRRRMLNIRFQ
ncbi:jg6975 [Pararge aegeria aegeria]|uniref:Jg6975 protein n=1 Tax=Pararge aegeria aegeria TaxID=348720 RepID=A0A8S4SMS9_9NEOP|nr:jg6975 [Pararge aegeria aegeria]